jgi:hypothetical protein
MTYCHYLVPAAASLLSTSSLKRLDALAQCHVSGLEGTVPRVLLPTSLSSC